jgi:hypothetical protein
LEEDKMSKNSSPILLVGSLVSLIVYLAAPVLRIAFILGVNGIQAIQWLSAWYLVPVIALICMAIAAVLGGRNGAMIAGGGASVVMILFLLAFKGIATSGNIGVLTSQLGQQAGSALGNAGYGTMATSLTTQLLLNPAWGFYLSAGCTLATFVLTFIVGDPAAKRTAVGSAHSSQQTSYRKFYRP